MTGEDDVRLVAYLRERLAAARRRGRRRLVWGMATAASMAVLGGYATRALRDPEGVVEMLSVHTGRHLQATAVRSLEAGAPSIARMAERQLDRVPSEVNAVVGQELSGWADRSADTLVDRTAEHLGALAHAQTGALGEALGLAPGDAPVSEETTRSRVRTLMAAELRPLLIDDVELLGEGPTAYLVATANAIEGLQGNEASAEQLLEAMLLELLATLIEPA